MKDEKITEGLFQKGLNEKKERINMDTSRGGKSVMDKCIFENCVIICRRQNS